MTKDCERCNGTACAFCQFNKVVKNGKEKTIA